MMAVSAPRRGVGVDRVLVSTKKDAIVQVAGVLRVVRRVPPHRWWSHVRKLEMHLNEQSNLKYSQGP